MALRHTLQAVGYRVEMARTNNASIFAKGTKTGPRPKGE
ncbi:Unannotated [Lentimonas sp. CC19]|nr:Unannotated [Lentimonas sp. CC4]CAA6685496.1 Unannotated [Lentimonas sp. CC6]CAA6690520.1 Unannotated [Lentimonas sp. CC10]CAA6693273.1 Unannotated [Lentimonas sp. CC19]CAA7068777.1 Unannotated [Lentimonas sp. CC11]CAA7170495.1 Unannotated [Lentimonas sp. CC21]CAA7179809.1 Unannotated [Lentimonas sp. CC8]